MRKSVLASLLGLCLAGTAGTAAAQTGVNSPTGLVARWTFDNITANTVPDITGNGYDGIIGGGASAVNGCMRFDGSDDLVRINKSLDANSFTYTTWMKKEAGGQYTPTLMASINTGGWAVGFLGTGGPVGITGDTNLFLSKVDIGHVKSVAVGNDQWQHIAVSFANNVVKFYVNGVLRETLSYNVVFGSNSGPYNMGLRLTPNGRVLSTFKGWMDDTRLYNYALSDADIASVSQIQPSCVVQCADSVDNDGDGLIDLNDPGCSSPTDPDESDGTSQCQDGVDNDGDGATDLADFSCQNNKLKNDEASPKAQCQDGIDNDSDGAVDLADFSCSGGAQDNDETNPKSQCQDGIDNDSDGLVDMNDPGCTSKQGNNEGAATAQCRDGVDNDGDGATDFPADFSCLSATDLDETNSKSQCQDGIDNDSDGATDLTDFSCQSNKQRNDETNPKSQCQDGIDNDTDRLTDLTDPGCSGKQDNNEGDGTSQCQDGVDNDGDGATDFPADFSCLSATDLDETNPKSQCQDGIDNDNDGAADLNDFSCQSNKQRNDEGSPKAGCQDGIDNDSDGAVDLADPGCSNGQDNIEGDEVARLSVSAECVMDNSDGSKVAYFSYNNTTTGTLQIPVGSSGTPLITNIFLGVAQNQGQPTSFAPGIQRGVIGVVFTNEVTWSVRAPQSTASQATASAATPKCGKVEPQFNCQGYNQGVLEIKAGYSNPNPFTVQLPYGTLNTFSPSPTVRGQPTVFLPGLKPGAFVIRKGTNDGDLFWELNGRKAQANQSLASCSGQCAETPVGTIRGELDDIAVELAKITKDAADVLAAAADDSDAQDAKSSRAGRRRKVAAVERSDVDAQRAKAKADEYAAEAKSLTIQFPDVIKNCPDAPATCSTVDRSATIEQLEGLYASMRNQAQRVIARAYYRQTGSTSRKDALVKKAKDLERRGLKSLAKLPRTETVCK